MPQSQGRRGARRRRPGRRAPAGRARHAGPGRAAVGGGRRHTGHRTRAPGETGVRAGRDALRQSVRAVRRPIVARRSVRRVRAARTR